MKKINLILTILVFSITACQSENKKNYMHPLPPIKMRLENIDSISIHNIGTLCYRRKKTKELEALYFPLNSTCIPSSDFEYDYTMQIKPQGKEFNIKIEGGYRSKHAKIALTDCAGAGIKRIKIHLLSNAPVTIKWNGDILGVLPSQVDKIYCFKREGGNIVKDDKLKSYFNKIPKI